MNNFWIAIYMMLAIMVIFLMPTAIYVYESDEEKSLVIFLFIIICLVGVDFQTLLCDFFRNLHAYRRCVDFVYFVGLFKICRDPRDHCIENYQLYGIL